MPARKPHTSKKYKWNIGIVITIMGLLLVGVVIFFITGGSMVGEKANMEKYLDDKYAKTFTVMNVKTDGAGVGMAGTKIGDAKPEDDVDLTFQVYRDPTGTYRDNYPGAIWTKEEAARLAPIISETFNGSAKFSLDIQSARALGGDLSIKGSIPPFATAINLYEHKIRYNLTITRSGSQPSTLNKDLISSQLLELRNTLPIDEVSSFIDYYINIDSTHLYGVSLSGDDLKNVKTASELVDQFKEYRKASL